MIRIVRPELPMSSLAPGGSRLLVLAWLWCQPLLAGPLRFEAERLEIKVGPEQEQVEAAFPFVNEGPKPVRVESVVSDCACLKAEAPRGDLAPGAKGEVRGFFKVGNFRGTVEKRMTVRVRDGERLVSVPLTVAIVVPELMRIEPPTLTWTIGEPVVEKSFRLRVLWPEDIQLLKIDCVRPEFAFRIETVVPGREYLVHAKPLRNDLPCIGLCQFQTDCRFERFRNPYGFVHLRRPLQAAER